MMKNALKSITLTLVLSGLTGQAWAATRYIMDVIHVPVRSGQSAEHRILHEGLESGTKVTLLEEGSEYSKIRTADGIEGWVESQYLTSEPSARLQLVQAKQVIDQLTQDTQPLRAEITALKETKNQLTAQVEALQNENQALKQEFAETRRASDDSLQLNDSNRKLIEQNQLLKNDIDLLEANINRLKSSTQQEWFLNGVLAVGMGGLLCLVLPRVFSRRRKHSEWR